METRSSVLPFRIRNVTEDGLNLVGLAVPFDSPTRIFDPYLGEFDEQFAKGAFKRTLGMKTPIMQYQHGRHPLLGNIPIARIRSLKETDNGLEVSAEVFDNWLTEPVRDAIRGGGITGMSITFRSLKETVAEREDDVPLVTVEEADLRELGPVIGPAYEDTWVDLRSVNLSDKSERSRLVSTLLAMDVKEERSERTSDSGSAHSVAKNKLRLLEL